VYYPVRTCQDSQIPKLKVIALRMSGVRPSHRQGMPARSARSLIVIRTLAIGSGSIQRTKPVRLFLASPCRPFSVSRRRLLSGIGGALSKRKARPRLPLFALPSASVEPQPFSRALQR